MQDFDLDINAGLDLNHSINKQDIFYLSGGLFVALVAALVIYGIIFK